MKTQLDLAIDALEQLQSGEVSNEYQVIKYALSLLKEYQKIEKRENGEN